MDYILGMSGGGSSTEVNIATLKGVVLQSYTVGAINLYYANEEEISRNLAEVFMTAHLAGYAVGSCRQICMGVVGMQGAGVSVKLAPVIRSVMRRCGYVGDALITGEDHIALAGALGQARGAILIADDTTACYGQNHMGVQHRTGGLGPLGDDDGSAYAIGREILRTVARAADRRGPFTQLSLPVFRALGVLGMPNLALLMRGGALAYEQVCGLSTLLAGACQAKDKAAFAILDRACNQLLAMVSPVVERLRLQEGQLAVAGKVLLNDAFVGISFKKMLKDMYPGLQCVPPRSDAAAGAVLLARERLALRGWA